MGKIKSFLNQTSEITNGQRLQICVSILGLAGIGLYLNNKLLKARLDNIDKDYNLEVLRIILAKHDIEMDEVLENADKYISGEAEL